MSMRQFGRFPGLPRPTPQTIQMLLEQRKTILPNVSKITLEWSKIGPGNGGIRWFKYDYLEPIKHWNPNVKVELKKEKTKPVQPRIIITKTDGQVLEFNAKHKRAEELVRAIVQSIDGASTSVTLPDPRFTPYMQKVRNAMGITSGRSPATSPADSPSPPPPVSEATQAHASSSEQTNVT